MSGETTHFDLYPTPSWLGPHGPTARVERIEAVIHYSDGTRTEITFPEGSRASMEIVRPEPSIFYGGHLKQIREEDPSRIVLMLDNPRIREGEGHLLSFNVVTPDASADQPKEE